MIKRLKAWLDKGNETWLGSRPLHERDQIEEAAKTWRGTFRHIWVTQKVWLLMGAGLIILVEWSR